MPERPNIILIMTDQQRFDTIGAWGYDYAITPAMNRLAAEGLSFRNAFCPGATCIASRAAIFTGMYPHNTGVYSFDHWADHRNWVQDLNDAGYHCVNIGKMTLLRAMSPGASTSGSWWRIPPASTSTWAGPTTIGAAICGFTA